MTFLFGTRRAASNRKIVGRLNEEIVAAVRNPAFYEAGGVPDSFNGRFEMLVMHAGLVVRRLRGLDDPAPALAQDLIDLVFRNLDPALRELGVGDMAVPKRMKALAEGFLGRAVAYDKALLEPDDAGLAAALVRNVYGGARAAGGLARYVRAAAGGLDRMDLDDLLQGPLRFPDPAVFLVHGSA